MHARTRNKFQARKDPIALRRHATASAQAVSVLEYIRRPVTHRVSSVLPVLACVAGVNLPRGAAVVGAVVGDARGTITID
jgi:hypothetical protein